MTLRAWTRRWATKRQQASRALYLELGPDRLGSAGTRPQPQLVLHGSVVGTVSTQGALWQPHHLAFAICPLSWAMGLFGGVTHLSKQKHQPQFSPVQSSLSYRLAENRLDGLFHQRLGCQIANANLTLPLSPFPHVPKIKRACVPAVTLSSCPVTVTPDHKPPSTILAVIISSPPPATPLQSSHILCGEYQHHRNIIPLLSSPSTTSRSHRHISCLLPIVEAPQLPREATAREVAEAEVEVVDLETRIEARAVVPIEANPSAGAEEEAVAEAAPLAIVEVALAMRP